MSRVLASATAQVCDSASPVAFCPEVGPHSNVYDRYISVDGEWAHHIGNLCGTCRFLFKRLRPGHRSVRPEAVVRALSDGLTSPDAPEVAQIQRILPNGSYRVSLHELLPEHVSPGGPNDYFVKEQVATWGVDGGTGKPFDPRTEYYRAGTYPITDTASLYEFLVPLYPSSLLHHDTLCEVTSRLTSGRRPTALAIAILDIKASAVWPDDVPPPPHTEEHWCLTHYLLDGHHKTFAAAAAHCPLTLLSFLAIDRGVSQPNQVEQVIELLRGQLGCTP